MLNVDSRHQGTDQAPNASKRRWHGPLSPDERAKAQAQGVPLAYDPGQSGWVFAGAPDIDDDPDMPIWACLARFVLRPWRDEDVEVFHALLDDASVWRYMIENMPQPFTRAVAADLISISNAGLHHEVRAIQTVQGLVGQSRMLWTGPELAPDEAEISYWLGNTHRGRGWASGAVKQMAASALTSRVGLRRVLAYVHPDNSASVRVLLRAGFVPTQSRASDGWLGFAMSRQQG